MSGGEKGSTSLVAWIDDVKDGFEGKKRRL
jgi:hypothetical protein